MPLIPLVVKPATQKSPVSSVWRRWQPYLLGTLLALFLFQLRWSLVLLTADSPSSSHSSGPSAGADGTGTARLAVILMLDGAPGDQTATLKLMQSWGADNSHPCHSSTTTSLFIWGAAPDGEEWRRQVRNTFVSSGADYCFDDLIFLDTPAGSDPQRLLRALVAVQHPAATGNSATGAAAAPATAAGGSDTSRQSNGLGRLLDREGRLYPIALLLPVSTHPGTALWVHTARSLAFGTAELPSQVALQWWFYANLFQPAPSSTGGSTGAAPPATTSSSLLGGVTLVALHEGPLSAWLQTHPTIPARPSTGGLLSSIADLLTNDANWQTSDRWKEGFLFDVTPPSGLVATPPGSFRPKKHADPPAGSSNSTGAAVAAEDALLLDMLRRHANPDKTIVIAAVNQGFLDFAYNWICSLQHGNFKNYFMFASDQQAYDALTARGIPAVYTSCASGTNDPLRYGTLTYQELMSCRTHFILRVLKLGYHPLLSDIDAVWLSDPLKFILQDGTYDMQYQDDVYIPGNGKPDPPINNVVVCGGFLYMRSTPVMVSFWQEVYDQHRRLIEELRKPGPHNVDATEQAIINTLLPRRPAVKSHPLPRVQFPSGRAYFDLARDGDVVVVHNNYIVGREAKLKRFREKTLWYLSGPASNLTCNADKDRWPA